MNKARIERELLQRAEWFLAQKHLLVDYYRVRRKIAYPLPVRRFSILGMPLRDDPSPDYPWATWLSWALEERIHVLGGCGELFGNTAAREAARRDIDALAQWPAYRQYEQPDLSLGHTARTLWAAHRNWSWLGGETRALVEAAFARLIEDVLPFSEKKHGAYKHKKEVLALPDPLPALHNIPLIGTIGAALAAHAIRHPAEAIFNQRIAMIFGALLDYRATGFTEGVAYDGYVLDFIADWLPIAPAAEREAILRHPQLPRQLDESVFLGAPGNILQVAELSDVEPREMTFHVSAQAKLLAFDPSQKRQWYLRQCDPAWLRADALAALFAADFSVPVKAPETGLQDAHYARVLRSGWESGDFAVCVATTTSDMGHMQCDGGTIVIGSAGKWLIADPGYQQYMGTSEREFTLGSGAHNAPVIDGHAQNSKRPVARNLVNLPPGIIGVEVDLTACYPAELKLASVRRTVWLRQGGLVVVADRIAGSGLKEITWHWQGHPDTGWWVADGMARISLPGAALWIACPGVAFAETQIDRQRGSRGQLALTVKTAPAPVAWWVFSASDAAPAIEKTATGLRVDGVEFPLST